ncbi:PIG-X [Schizophyllum amplum]|uniref:Protein PBN1 n=1 Tax=Schizophyllum amplum TaxID=97359 RepID=A0A550CRQ2_9AGAR|nr:PIG-X [Auriculariopsis ampla]
MDARIGTYESALFPNHGYHPTSKTRIHVPDASLREDCTLQLHFVLPPHIFADRYELQNYAPRLQFTYRGSANLELPVFALNSLEESELLVSVSLNEEEKRKGEVEVDVPLHLRYGGVLPADASTTHEEIFIRHPEAFMACPESKYAQRGAVADPQSLIADLTNSTIVPLQAANAREGEIVRLPVGQAAHSPIVELGTSSVILLTFIYLVFKSCKTFSRIEQS